MTPELREQIEREAEEYATLQVNQDTVPDAALIPVYRKICAADYRKGAQKYEEQVEALRAESEHNYQAAEKWKEQAISQQEAGDALRAQVEMLEEALKFYAQQGHFEGLDEWEVPSGEAGILCPPNDLPIHVEDGSAARQALARIKALKATQAATGEGKR